MTDGSPVPPFVTGSFSYRLEDVWKAHVAYRKLRRGGGIMRIISVVLFVLLVLDFLSALPLIVVFLVIRNSAPIPAVDRLIGLAGLLLLAFVLLLAASAIELYQPITRWRIAADFRRNRKIYESEYTLAADRESFRVSHPEYKISLEWPKIDRVCEYADGFIVLFNDGDNLTIPKRAFRDAAAVEAFRNLVTREAEKEISTIQ